MAKNPNINKDYSNPPQFVDRLFNNMYLDDYQYEYANAIWDKDSICIMVNARSGTGKTTIACGVGDMLVKYGRYDGIVYIASPTQEQRQGYLPGSIEEKSAPYFEPMFEAMDACNMSRSVLISSDNIDRQKNGLSEYPYKTYVECMTHTFLRGNTIENKVVIVDEAQNYYTDELQKTLTRLKDSCKIIIIGHTGQIDLYKNRENSGFDKYLAHFSKVKDDPRVKICKLVNNYRGWFSKYADAINDPELLEDLILEYNP